MIYFITGNVNKFVEAKAMVPELEQLDIDLAEIQSLDPREIIEFKLREAAEHHDGDLIVEDTSLCLECLNGLPGPLIKWFLKTIGNKGIFQIVDQSGNNQALARTMIGLLHRGKIEYFEGTLRGTIVSPRGDRDFGWGPIFVPEGCNKTFGEMDREEKHALSMRGKAFGQLKEHLNN